MLTISEKNMNSCPERSDTVPGSRFFSGKRVSLNNFIGLVQSVDRETMIFRLSCASCGDTARLCAGKQIVTGPAELFCKITRKRC